MINIGDRIVVYQLPFPSYVERIDIDNKTGVTTIFLDWKEFGKSKVYLHDENKVWYKYISNS
jgi:hypothetical protein